MSSRVDQLKKLTLCQVIGGVFFILWQNGVTDALDNGLVLTPPMGFNTWERYRCTIDCYNFPNGCIDETLIMKTADEMSLEYLQAGYEFLVIDDCWLADKRSWRGDLVPDANRFPSGIRALARYVHERGLKFGIYGNFGERTCAGFPGIKHDLKRDADLFASWGVDFVKLDGCFSDHHAKAVGYPEFGRYLNESGRQIVYSCSWPSYLIDQGIAPNYTALVQTCNLWRNYDDVEDSWASVLDIIEYYAKEQDAIGKYHGPGHWHDADMLLIGNFGLSYEQAKSQMALWCVMGVPLFMSTDLTEIKKEFKDILLNRGAIAINQDPLGSMGRRISKKRGIQVWRRQILPQNKEYTSYAIAVLNGRVDGAPKLVEKTPKELGLYNPNGYIVQDIFDGYCVKFDLHQVISAKIPPSGVVLWKFTVIQDGKPLPTCFQFKSNKIKREIKPSSSSYSVYAVGLMYLASLTMLVFLFMRGRFHKIFC